MVNKRLEDKANSSGVVVIPLNHTLQTCSTPKHHARENHKSQAVTKCVACGYEADADINKAQNIIKQDLRSQEAEGHRRHLAMAAQRSANPRKKKWREPLSTFGNPLP